jgi:cupin 2 domain-containing protein
VDNAAPPPRWRQGRLDDGIPPTLPAELVTILAADASVRIERIVSRGHASPPGFWYDQDEDELVLVVTGAAHLAIEGADVLALGPGDWVELPRHCRHRVEWTDPDRDTIWLAIFRR